MTATPRTPPDVPRPETGELHLYCENPDCAAREIRVHVKAYDADVRPPYACPLCRTARISRHAALTANAWREDRDRRGLAAVHSALLRRLRPDDEFVFLSRSIFQTHRILDLAETARDLLLAVEAGAMTDVTIAAANLRTCFADLELWPVSLEQRRLPLDGN